MDPLVFNEFQEIVTLIKIKERVLEVGAIPSSDSLLTIDALSSAERVGINIKGDIEFGGFKIIEGNGNNMSMFPTGYFDLVMSNATIEHDPFFWKTCAEMRRVLRVDGTAIIGGPGFTHETGLTELGIQVVPWEDDLWKSQAKSALTFRYHGAPMDYYRFSPTAFHDVIFEGYRDVSIKSIMVPPRIIAYGFKC
jgi:SAM-dependent methyltransferase